MADRLAAIKLERGCADCGYREHAIALDFDHAPDEAKSFPISRSWAYQSWEAIAAEVAKCEVVCANCHRVRTLARRQQGGQAIRVDSGTLTPRRPEGRARTQMRLQS